MKRSAGLDVAALALREVTEPDRQFGRVRFATGRPVAFVFVRNMEKAPKTAGFGQDIEPAGRYVVHPTGGGPPLRGWEYGVASLRSPLVLALTLDDRIYGPLGWKARLTAATGRTGRALSRRLVQAGYDAVVTVRDGPQPETAEIVLLPPGRGSA